MSNRENKKMAKINPDVMNAELTGQIHLIQLQVTTLEEIFKEKFSEINKKLDSVLVVQDTYISKQEFNEVLKIVNPAIKWVQARQAIEKFFFGGIAIIGFSNFLLVVKLLVS